MAVYAASSVQALITRFKRSKPEASTNFCLQLFNDAAKRLGTSLELSQQKLTQSLIALQQEYVLSPNIMTIQEVYYVNSNLSGDSYPLIETNVDKLAEGRVGWRTYQNTGGGPWEWYLATTQTNTQTNPGTPSTTAPGSSMVLGLVQLPQTTTAVSGFPCLNLYCSLWVPFALTDTVPDHLGGDDVWIDALEELYAKGHLPNEWQFRQQVAAQSRQQTVARVIGAGMQDIPRMSPAWARRRRKV
jgi:hypothetical protein